MKKFVVLEHLYGPGFRFWSMNTDDNTMGGGKVAYKEVLFTDSEDEAIAKTKENHSEADYFINNLMQMPPDMLTYMYGSEEEKKELERKMLKSERIEKLKKLSK